MPLVTGVVAGTGSRVTQGAWALSLLRPIDYTAEDPRDDSPTAGARHASRTKRATNGCARHSHHAAPKKCRAPGHQREQPASAPSVPPYALPSAGYKPDAPARCRSFDPYRYAQDPTAIPARSAGRTARTRHRPQQPAAPTIREDAYATRHTPAEPSLPASSLQISPQTSQRGEKGDC
jgi:hypothetical protein